MAGFAACFFVPPFSFADIYRYVDPQGVIHFTNAPTHGKFELILKEERIQFRVGPALEKYDLAIWKAAEKYGMDYAFIKAVIKAESNFNPKAFSRAGAKGLMQLMPKTAHALAVTDSFHPEDNIDGGVRYLRYLSKLFDGNFFRKNFRQKAWKGTADSGHRRQYYPPDETNPLPPKHGRFWA